MFCAKTLQAGYQGHAKISLLPVLRPTCSMAGSLKPQSRAERTLSEMHCRTTVPKKHRFETSLSDRSDKRNSAELEGLRASFSSQNGPLTAGRRTKRKSR